MSEVTAVRGMVVTLLLGSAAMTCTDAAPRPVPSAPAPPTAGVEVAALPHQPTRLVPIEAGFYRPMFPGKDQPEQVAVAAFLLEEHAVTNAQFLAFVQRQAGWRRSRVKTVFADATYLRHWRGDLEPGREIADCPVTNVSWFAARAYARWLGRRLPSLAEWEYVAGAGVSGPRGTDEPGFHRRILDWYSKPSPDVPAPVGSASRNWFGVADMHGLIWEWVDDFNTALVTGESRGDAALERSLFCGAGSLGAAEPADYAAFMRFAFRSSLRASYAVKNTGFRCAVDRD